MRCFCFLSCSKRINIDFWSTYFAGRNRNRHWSTGRSTALAVNTQRAIDDQMHSKKRTQDRYFITRFDGKCMNEWDFLFRTEQKHKSPANGPEPQVQETLNEILPNQFDNKINIIEERKKLVCFSCFISLKANSKKRKKNTKFPRKNLLYIADRNLFSIVVDWISFRKLEEIIWTNSRKFLQ